MVKTFRCADLGLSCIYEVEAKDEHEIMRRIEKHVQTAHAMNPEIPEVRMRLRKVLRG